ncbi:HD domain-containing protein [Barrientosiimonas endolithica]|uniref:HD/PDEase domain-containing protein n=1 Tax=Barrientosiimonas endolithica TaxID=1535208 RepID=A0ABM8HCI5_9MICO|nr:HD domain-containing protein [Barrientosiimonas endolithica]BDZ58680.1 hypothetical protein GCM10025872_23370 [Barrientosiimonas endolithica]
MRLDHAVRTPAESRKVAADDLGAAVGLLDIAHVAGDPVLSAAVQQSVAHDWRSNARKRLPELVEQVGLRHARHGDLTTALEPDLKEARGGLRDMTILRSLTAAWLTDRPHGSVDEAYERLLDVRDAVHVVTGRGRDRLAREDQDATAALLGLPDADALLTEVVRSARGVAFALDSTLRRASQAQRARTLRVGPRRPTLRPLGFGLFEHDGEVVLGRRTPPGDQLLLMRAAAAAARRNLPLAPVTVRNLTRDLAPLPQPWSEAQRAAFVDLLASGPGLVQVWEALDLAGVIAQWIPEWKAVSSRPQRSPVHRHTVDRHLVETVVEAAARRRDVDRPDLLLVTALLHDIGKIAGVHDHAVEGAPVAASIARRMGFGPDDVAAVELLVRQHLALVDLATRRDPQDPSTVRELVAVVEERPELLEQLRALTEADAVAAGPSAWTSWRARLVQDLSTLARDSLAGRRALRTEPGGAEELLTPQVMERLLVGRRTSRSCPSRAVPASRSSTATGWACSPTPRGCWPRTAWSCGPPGCAPSRRRRSTCGTSRHPRASCRPRPTSRATCAGWPAATGAAARARAAGRGLGRAGRGRTPHARDRRARRVRRRHRHRGAGRRPARPAARHRPDHDPARAGGALGARGDVRRADARHVLRHRRPGAHDRPAAGGSGHRGADRRLRRHPPGGRRIGRDPHRQLTWGPCSPACPIA